MKQKKVSKPITFTVIFGSLQNSVISCDAVLFAKGSYNLGNIFHPKVKVIHYGKSKKKKRRTK